MYQNILIPRNLDGRKDKLKQYNIELLSKEVIEGDIEIDKSFEDIPEELIKVKEIYGNVRLIIYKGYIPSWLKHVKICGYFDCSHNKLTSLECCPQYIGGGFYCDHNKLETLKNCPQYIRGNFWCEHNKLTSLECCPQYIGGNLYCGYNIKILELPKEVELKGIFYN